MGSKKWTMALILGLLTAGCATAPSEYNQGCRDGVTVYANETQRADVDSSTVNKECDALDSVHNRLRREIGGRK